VATRTIPTPTVTRHLPRNRSGPLSLVAPLSYCVACWVSGATAHAWLLPPTVLSLLPAYLLLLLLPATTRQAIFLPLWTFCILRIFAPSRSALCTAPRVMTTRHHSLDGTAHTRRSSRFLPALTTIPAGLGSQSGSRSPVYPRDPPPPLLPMVVPCASSSWFGREPDGTVLLVDTFRLA